MLTVLVISFVLNNGGYTIERLIHGKEAEYNDVAIYDYAILANAFGPAFKSKYHGTIRTCGQLIALLQTPGFGDEGCLSMVEVILPALDAPKAVIKTGATIDEFNKSQTEKKGVVGA